MSEQPRRTRQRAIYVSIDVFVGSLLFYLNIGRVSTIINLNGVDHAAAEEGTGAKLGMVLLSHYHVYATRPSGSVPFSKVDPKNAC